ncbi:MAG: fibronectin type III domain-containing protein, partial [Gammaproteobacteria bacterium]|nr:fibronectin type III domain-containing protein [Gammaproteobacteria bacterium]
PEVCSVDSSSGLVTALTPDTCIIAANQFGNTTFAPAPQVTQSIPVLFDPDQTISFAAAPELTLFSTATVSATASSGLAVSYSSTTPGVCSVDSNSGLVTDFTTGDCIIAANQAGSDKFIPAPEVTQTITVTMPSGVTVPAAPTEVTATAGATPNSVTVSFGATGSGGSPITGYTIQSNPSGITGTGTASPISVACPSSCTGYAFSVIASNIIGDSVRSAMADVITAYEVVETFFEPATQPKDSIFIGTFTFNSTSSTVSNLRGTLSESMTGDSIAYPNDNMTWLLLDNQLSSVSDPVLGGLLVTTFRNPTTDTLFVSDGSDGWSPGTGFGLYFGFDFTAPGVNPGNAYAMIFVNTLDPTAALTLDQIDKLAYADCAPGGMMAATCMTGTTIAGYGTAGTMGGYPVSQVITRLP